MTTRAPTDPVTLTFEAQQVNVLIALLWDAPWRVADPILRAIRLQTGGEQPAEASPPAKPNGSGDDAMHAAALAP